MSRTPTPIALDAMGGDHAPSATVEGAILAVRELGIPVVLVGQEAEIAKEIARHDTAGLSLPVVAAEETIGMAEHPAMAVRQKRRSSMVVGIDMVRDGRASAFVSAGNSGAVMAAALFGLGRIEGVERPAIGTVYPTTTGTCFVLDIGANADCKPEYLLQFGIMGAAYFERVFGVPNPRVGLLSNGEEEGKGNSLIQATFPLLKASGLNFVGNVEGKDIPMGTADVVICDGFAGNVVVKLSEGVASAMFDILKTELTANLLYKIAAAVLKPAFRRAKHRLDYVEYGGAPLLGVNGVVSIAHGRSNALAVKNAVRVAALGVEQRLVETIRAGIGEDR